MTQTNITSEALTTALPKWPGFIVTGQAVTPEQAKIIILRTSGLVFCTNDTAWEKLLYEAAGIDCEKYGPIYESQEAAWMRYGILDLDYLDNHRIASCWIGGPHGWCDWNGSIGCNNSNIGKWPSVEEVYDEWIAIARTFPYLQLECQLLSAEMCEDYATPLIQYSISSGHVSCCLSDGERIMPARASDPIGDIGRLLRPGGERGCSLATFQKALALCER